MLRYSRSLSGSERSARVKSRWVSRSIFWKASKPLSTWSFSWTKSPARNFTSRWICHRFITSEPEFGPDTDDLFSNWFWYSVIHSKHSDSGRPRRLNREDWRAACASTSISRPISWMMTADKIISLWVQKTENIRGDARMNPHNISMLGALTSNRKRTSETKSSKEAIMTEKVCGNDWFVWCVMWKIKYYNIFFFIRIEVGGRCRSTLPFRFYSITWMGRLICFLTPAV